MLNSEDGGIKVKSEYETCPTGTYSAENNNKMYFLTLSPPEMPPPLLKTFPS